MIKDGATFPEDLSQPAPSGSAFNTREKIQYPEILPPDPQNLGKSTETIDALVAVRNLKPVFYQVNNNPGNIQVVPNQNVYLCDASGGNIGVNLLTATSHNGEEYTFKKIDSTSNGVEIYPVAGQLIDGNATIEIDIPQTSITLVSDGFNFYII